jgi:hypothetical protein
MIDEPVINSTVTMTTHAIKPLAQQALDIIMSRRQISDSEAVTAYIEEHSKPYRKWFKIVQRSITEEEADSGLRTGHYWGYPSQFGSRTKTIAEDLLIACAADLWPKIITIPVRDLARLTNIINEYDHCRMFEKSVEQAI